MARWSAGMVDKGRAALAGFGLVAAALGLGGCVENTADVTPAPDAHHEIARREGVSIAKASVAFVSLDGAPASVAAEFKKSFETAARARDIVLVERSKARYLVRGYLSAGLTSDGAAIEYVWDVFTADKERAQRLNDVVAAAGKGDDPWAMAGDAVLGNVAAKSADDLAAYLSYTPEAGEAAAAPQGSAARESAGHPQDAVAQAAAAPGADAPNPSGQKPGT
ncbi:MAG: hypothetical protein JO107_05485 [Hyphomicrobiales bacterium]|nr:hypothetical protein [Hyphomicrobiales bacterium]MBV8662535.1 hypothetical protein [Hyphomicrobiales bacterium]